MTLLYVRILSDLPKQLTPKALASILWEDVTHGLHKMTVVDVMMVYVLLVIL